MFFISWVYVVLTLFEPIHLEDKHLVKWEVFYSSLFVIEGTIISLFGFDILVAIFHNFFEVKFREMPNFSKRPRNGSKNKPGENPEEPESAKNKPQQNLLLRAGLTFIKKLNQRKAARSEELQKDPQASVRLDPSPSFQTKSKRLSFCNKLWLLFRTIATEGNLLAKLALFLIFLSDYLQFNILYPNQFIRYSRFFRTLAFPLFNKSTLRTLQAVYFSMRRIFDFLIFFSFVVFVYAGFGYKIFQDMDEPYHTHPFYDEYVNNYSSYSVIANSLMVLVTFDNYPLVMRPFIGSPRLISHQSVLPALLHALHPRQHPLLHSDPHRCRLRRLQSCLSSNRKKEANSRSTTTYPKKRRSSPAI